MRSILVIARRHLFPGLSPQGFLPTDAVDLDGLGAHLFFAERDYMEQNSHYKQLIPYIVLRRGDGADARVLCYQRRAKHTEARLGGLWSVGFGGHIEPVDRGAADVKAHGLVMATAVRELEEETGLAPGLEHFRMEGFINSDSEDVSAVHFGIVFSVDLDALPGSDDELIALVSSQAEPHQARWIREADLPGLVGAGNGPDGGSFEDWSRIAVSGLIG
jgi:predicted NUDIX family phosphoesterase